MRSILILILLLDFLPTLAQVSSAQQKALTAYVDYANASGEEISAVVLSAFKHHEILTSKYPDRGRYVCPFQMQEYFLSDVNAQSKNLPAGSSAEITKAFQALREAERKVDEKCKQLDTYYKLEDFKTDKYAQANRLIQELEPLTTNYQNRYRELHAVLEKSSKPNLSMQEYTNVDARLAGIIRDERKFLDEWKLNFNESTYTGWPMEKLQASISLTSGHLEKLNERKTALKYPASSMFENFKEVYGEYLQLKRRALDGHTYEASKSDKHKNDFYLDLINYFNGTLVADYNTFLKFSVRDGYYGLATFKYVPIFEMAQSAQVVNIQVKAFDDLSYSPINIIKQKTSISKATFNALSEYIEFINETWRQTRSLQSTLTSFNSSASYFKTLQSYEKRQPMYIDYSKFEVPHSYYQKVVSASKVLPPATAKSLNTQAEVIMNVLKEMDQLGASLDIEVKERRYEKDSLKHVYEILEREAKLFEIWDEKKEKVYRDVRQVFDSYVPVNKGSSWEKSGAALRNLVDLDHDAVFEAKKFYKGDSTVKIQVSDIEQTARTIISDEYKNMEGIQKLGRYNGNCPYSPYEDVPKTSRQLTEHFVKLEPRRPNTSRYNDPYYNIIYLYNDIVEDYNKFCELSVSVPHLKHVFQPEAFKVLYPQPTKMKQAKESLMEAKALRSNEGIKTVNGSEPEVSSGVNPSTNVSKEYSTHGRDTIYIEKRDTIYIREPNEELRSMEGYATNNMVLLLDVSASMNQPEKLPLLKESMLRMLEMMRMEDKISIIVFAAKPKVLLKSISFKEEERIKKAVSDLSSSGKTDGKSAIKMAYKVADESYIRGGNNRIILATDGEFAMDEDTRKLIADFSSNDIFLSVFNFGKGMGSSKTLQNLASLGKGNYEAISRENVDVKLIKEAKAKRKR